MYLFGSLHCPSLHLLDQTFLKKKKKTFTNYSKVESSLTEAIAVPQFDGVAAAVLLLTAADGQFTAGVCALDGDVRHALLDLTHRDRALNPSTHPFTK